MQKLVIRLKPLLILCMVFAFLSCGGGDGDGPPDPQPGPRTDQDVIDDFNNLDIQVGTNDLELESTAEGVFWKFRLIVPEGASSSNKKPLVLRLHGAAQANSATAHQTTECLVEPAFEGKDVYILSPNSNGELWESQFNQVQIQALMYLTTSGLDVDVNRVIVTGYSDGGNGSWFYSQYFPGYFNAAIPMATSYHNESNNGSVSKIDIPLYVIHGQNDELFPLATTQGFVDEYIDAGTDITFVVAPGKVHNEPCTYVDELKDAVDWLYAEIW